MKITEKQLRRIIRETMWGGFTGGAAPLDEPMRDSGFIPKDQLRRLADIFINDMGMSPEEVLSKPEFAEQGITDLRQLEEGKMKITKSQLRQIIKEENQKLLNERLGMPIVGARDLAAELDNVMADIYDGVRASAPEGADYVLEDTADLIIREVERFLTVNGMQGVNLRR
jgi:hypothetical protein